MTSRKFDPELTKGQRYYWSQIVVINNVIYIPWRLGVNVIVIELKNVDMQVVIMIWNVKCRNFSEKWRIEKSDNLAS